MIEFFNRLFGKPASGATAKERLRLVLLSDHIALAPELIEKLKAELVDVISRYVEVDRSKIEVNFEQQDKAVAMLANIPILSVNRPNHEDPPTAPTLALNSSSSGSALGAATAPAEAPPKKRRRRKRPAGQATSNPAPAT